MTPVVYQLSLWIVRHTTQEIIMLKDWLILLTLGEEAF